jgi:hypothetical protein
MPGKAGQSLKVQRYNWISNDCFGAAEKSASSPDESFAAKAPMTPDAVRREKAALSCGCKSHLATAPASSNRSGYGGNYMAEAFG